MGEMFLQRQAKSFRRQRCLEYEEVDRPTLFERLRDDELREAFTACLHSPQALLPGDPVNVVQDVTGLIAVARGLALIGTVREESLPGIRAILAQTNGVARFRVDELLGRTCTLILDEEE